MLLSRVAESVYWAGRYLERAEATARLVKIHTELFLDLPKAAGIGWSPLLAVTGTDDEFAQHYPSADEEHVIRFLTTDLDNPSSLLSSLSQARANHRITRAVFPGSSWEVLNHLYLWAIETRHQAVERRNRLGWMDNVVRQCQLMAGLLGSVMSHDEAYSFLEIGRFVERADMTTRVLDVQAGILLGRSDAGITAYADVTWISVLRSLSAYQMFRRTVGAGVSGPEALRFLLQDEQFPRSVEHCMTEVSRSLLELPRYDEPMAGCATVQQLLEDATVATLDAEALHVYVDALQVGIDALHQQVADTYFRVAPASSGALLATA